MEMRKLNISEIHPAASDPRKLADLLGDLSPMELDMSLAGCSLRRASFKSGGSR
jgi:hypothetical protein